MLPIRKLNALAHLLEIEIIDIYMQSNTKQRVKILMGNAHPHCQLYILVVVFVKHQIT